MLDIVARAGIFVILGFVWHLPKVFWFYSLCWEVWCNSNGSPFIGYLTFFPYCFQYSFFVLCIWIFNYYVTGEIYFLVHQFGVLEASCIFMGISFFKLGRFSSIILSNIFAGPLNWESVLSSIPIILMFQSFHCSWVSWMFWVRNFLLFAFSSLLCQCLLWYFLPLRFSLLFLVFCCWWSMTTCYYFVSNPLSW